MRGPGERGQAAVLPAGRDHTHGLSRPVPWTQHAELGGGLF